jgi:hypothetical protein
MAIARNAMHEENALRELAEKAEAALNVFMRGFFDDIVQAYVSAPNHTHDVNIGEWVEDKTLDELLGAEKGLYYTKWFTTFLKLTEQKGDDSFDLLNEALRKSGLSGRFLPMTMYTFYGNYFLMRTSEYEANYGDSKLGAVRYTTASIL